MKKLLLATAVVALTGSVTARDHISIVGSSTVFPFASVVSEAHGKSGFKSPHIESTGSGGGMKLFCAGIGPKHPDITNASRAIKSSEKKLCAKNNVTPIERLIGYDGIAFANSRDGKKFSLTKEEIYLAIARKVPAGKTGKNWNKDTMIDNPFTTWNQINSKLPNQKIDILVPPPTSGTRDAFVELVMHKTCKSYGMPKKGANGYKKQCSQLREDEHVTIVGENDNLIIQKLGNDSNRFGIFGFSFLDQNMDKVQGAVINGKEASFETIADGSYPISRPLFYYIKKEHMDSIPGINEYDKLFAEMAKPEGRLEDLGLITIQ